MDKLNAVLDEIGKFADDDRFSGLATKAFSKEILRAVIDDLKTDVKFHTQHIEKHKENHKTKPSSRQLKKELFHRAKLQDVQYKIKELQAAMGRIS